MEIPSFAGQKGSIGFALYSELGLSTDHIELETKLIFDKKIGDTLFCIESDRGTGVVSVCRENKYGT